MNATGGTKCTGRDMELSIERCAISSHLKRTVGAKEIRI
jgi:hypothetical protein